MTITNEYVIVVAGGSGARFGSEIPKQFLELNGLPVLMHTINRFVDYNQGIICILALPADQHKYWSSLCLKYNFSAHHIIVNGGKTRFHSVKNALEKISGKNKLIAVHDGVRPLVPVKVIKDAFELAKEKGAAVPVIDIPESIRMKKGNSSIHVNRNEYKLVQTPQVFKSDIILTAYNSEYKDAFTDDASVVQNSGVEIFLSEGSKMNIKITTPEDLQYAGYLLSQEV